MTKFTPAIAILSMMLVGSPSRGAEPGNVDFGKHVLPILGQKCQQCHGGIHQQGGLDLRSLDAMLKGGQSGPAVKLDDRFISSPPVSGQMYRGVA